jgi:hypothetical protein
MGNQRPRFSQTESHLAEKPLALPRTKLNVMEFIQVMGKQSPIPEVLCVPKLPRVSPQIAVNGLPLRTANTPRAAFPFPFAETRKSALFETLNPSFHSARVLPENISNLITGEPLRYQQDAMQSVIIAGFFGSQDFLLHCNTHNLGIGDLQFTHSCALLTINMTGGAYENNLFMRHYLCRFV